MFLAAINKYPPMALAADKYEFETTRLIERICKPGMSFVDVGAHVGYYTLLAARAVGSSGKVYSFEPEPDNYNLLTHNIEVNHYANVVAINKGVSDSEVFTNLYVASLDNGRSSLHSHNMPYSDRITIETTSLDTFFEQLGWPQIDLMKIDVEGSEESVWSGMKLLRLNYPDLNIVVEYNPALLRSAKVDPVRFLQMLESSGFNLKCIDGGVGLDPMSQINIDNFSERIEARDTSVNLFCCR